MIAELKSAGVTTVIFTGDPVAPRHVHRGGDPPGLLPRVGDQRLERWSTSTAFARTYDQQQWAHAFGITGRRGAAPRGAGGQVWRLHEWYHGKPPAAKDTYGVLWFQPAVFYAALQAAGPKLTPETSVTASSQGKPRSG